MLPKYISQLSSDNSFFTKQYPDSNNCLLLDAQIGSIGKDLTNIDSDEYFIGGNTPIDKIKRISSRKATRQFLLDLRLAKEKKTVSLDCRNKIELQRQNESAALFNNQAQKSDNTVLSQTRNKQIAYATIGGVVVLTTLFLLIRKK